MPAILNYPGVYIEEIPSGVRTITGVATSITAFVGYTAQGPVDKAVRIFNFGDFERTFGGLDRNSEISYAVQQFFLNGGMDAYVVRVAQGAASAQVVLKDISGHDDVLVASAATPGAWGNNVRLDVDYATSNPDSTFNLIVTRYELQNSEFVPITSEKHINLSMNSHSATYALSVVNNASKLVQLASAGLNLTDATDRGYSLSGDLSSFPQLTAQNTTISGILDGTTPFTLVMTNPLPKNLNDLVSSLTAAISTAGLAGLSPRLQAERATVLGGDDPNGNFLKLKSLFVPGNPAMNVPSNPDTKAEFSSVQIIASPSNDAAKLLKLGLNNGGREKEGASIRRPAPTGTISADLSDILGKNVSDEIDITVNNNSTGSPVPTPVLIFSGKITNYPSIQVGPSLPGVLQKLINNLSDPSVQQATVQLDGSFLRIVSSADTSNASIVFSGKGATEMHLDTGSNPFINVQQYSLAGGANFGAQNAQPPESTAGSDGTPPTAAGIIGDYDAKTGIYALRDVDLFNLLVIPSTTKNMTDDQVKSVITAAIEFCGERRAFFLVDPDPSKSRSDIAIWVSSLNASSKDAAIFFPQIQFADPLDQFRLHNMPASGAIAGVFARTDSERGVWKAPAGIDAVLNGVQGLSYNLTDQENGVLNPLGINCLRTFPVYGRVVWGSRTLRGADQMADDYKYIPVRRMALYIEESLYRGTQWVVFEPNDEPLWAQIRLNIGAFMHTLFRQGAFQGKTPQEAYFVKCDKETTTQDDINKGIVNIVVGFAPLKPAEFVVIQIQQIAGQIQT